MDEWVVFERALFAETISAKLFRLAKACGQTGESKPRIAKG